MFKIKTKLFLLLFLLAPLSIFCQTWVDIYTDPICWMDSKGNIGIQVLPYQPYVSLIGEANYFSKQIQATNLNTIVGGATFNAGVRYYPFGIQTFLFSKRAKKAQWNKPYLDGCPNIDRSNYRITGTTELQMLLRGFYLGLSYQTQQYEANYEAPFVAQTVYHFKIQNKGGSASVGYMARLENISIGVNYTAALTEPKLTGTYNEAIKMAILNNNASHIDTQWQFLLGINF